MNQEPRQLALQGEEFIPERIRRAIARVQAYRAWCRSAQARGIPPVPTSADFRIVREFERRSS